MKKLCLFCLAFLLSFSLIGCGGKETNGPAVQQIEKPEYNESAEKNPLFDSTELLMVRQSMIETDAVEAVAFLGLLDGNYDDIKDHLDNLGMIDNLPFLADIPEDYYVELDGQELYCIIPRSEDAEITVYEWIVNEYNDYSGEPGNVLFTSKEGVPIFVRGNESEIVPNFMVEIIEDGISYEFTPCLSGFDGSLVVPEDPCWISDFTPYEYLGFNECITFDESILWSTGNWKTTIITSDETYIDAIFIFYDDGTMELCYGPTNEEATIFYEGFYMVAEEESYPENTYVFELYCTDGDNQDLYSVFQLTAYPEYNEVYLEWVDGDNLIDKDLYGQYLLSGFIG